MSTTKYVMKRYDDMGQFQGYICIDDIDSDNHVEQSTVPTLDEATKFELNDEGNLVYRCKGKKRTHDIVDFNINVVSIPFSCLMVTVESEQE